MKNAGTKIAGVAIALTLGAGFGSQAAAQTASNVICKGCVNSRDIKNSSVTSIDIKNGSLTGVDIKDGSITGADVKDGTVMPVDLAPAAKPAGAARNSDSQPTEVPTTDGGTSVVSVTVNLPGPGHVVLNATATAVFNDLSELTCYLAKAVTINPLNKSVLSAPAGQQMVAATNLVSEATAGPATYHLFCEALDATTISISFPAMTAIYVPSLL